MYGIAATVWALKFCSFSFFLTCIFISNNVFECSNFCLFVLFILFFIFCLKKTATIERWVFHLLPLKSAFSSYCFQKWRIMIITCLQDKAKGREKHNKGINISICLSIYKSEDFSSCQFVPILRNTQTVLLTSEYTVLHCLSERGGEEKQQKVWQHLKCVIQDLQDGVDLEKGILKTGLDPEVILWKALCVDFFWVCGDALKHLPNFRACMSSGSSQEPQYANSHSILIPACT